jgi:adenylate cyclase, class 2
LPAAPTKRILDSIPDGIFFRTFMLEIEKKYRLTKPLREAVLRRLPQIGAVPRGEEFEENTLYGGAHLEPGRVALRLRRVGKRAMLTYKERYPRDSAIKYQREDETGVADPDAMHTILEALGFAPAVVYEKRRQTWRLGQTEIVLDELPFGLFMEIEGSEADIKAIEKKIGLKALKAEPATYPQLAQKHGRQNGDVVEARFKPKRTSKKHHNLSD